MVRAARTSDGERDRPAINARSSGGGSRREEILAIAASIFARKGVANTTVRDIAREAGMLSGSLYHYFQSKEEMLDEIIRNALDADIAQDAALAASEDLEPRAAVRELFHRGLMFAADHPDVSAIVNDSSKEFVGTAAYDLVRTRDRAIRQAWTRVLERGVEAGAFRADLDVELAWQAMIAVVIMVGRWYRPSGPLTVEQIADKMSVLFLEGFEVSTPTP
ncbi:MAG: TetR family transcriptional regulator [Acidimicrobiales bacterium]|nr:TetR family transcriptional regulator [Acidimicrobiales bacterium]